ncbi:unnamed protein product [Bursaphelenchus okinawaensis]|uniref:Uncharacterized protein n=1 Tax=Bursaphelenchus okinawaensis TaxID=465554 RepID=A0A811KD41_9BILA|nr:unnamed protein product [Bursaphelenchus okinawaensis]CAG9102046.1 unnamed protein product [Bursaphelenchus okinawaensis]
MTSASNQLSATDVVIEDKLIELMTNFVKKTVALGLQGLLKEYTDLRAQSETADTVEKTTFSANPTKNRYKDIPCVEKTRVKLKWPMINQKYGDYIHANRVDDMPGVRGGMILTQGPMQTTVEDFWRMIWQEKSQAIVMLCSVMENGKKKCEQYFPAEKGGVLKDEGKVFAVTNVEGKKEGLQTEEDLVYTQLMMEAKKSTGKVGKHIVNHVLWTGWPDKAVPLTASGAMVLLQKISKYDSIVIHCSAGVGRTGTIAAIKICWSALMAGEELNVFETVKKLRSKRYLACQTDLQYLYIHMALLSFITSKGVMNKEESLKTFFQQYQALVKARIAAGEK